MHDKQHWSSSSVVLVFPNLSAVKIDSNNAQRAADCSKCKLSEGHQFNPGLLLKADSSDLLRTTDNCGEYFFEPLPSCRADSPSSDYSTAKADSSDLGTFFSFFRWWGSSLEAQLNLCQDLSELFHDYLYT